jgi:hypothetical protein
MQDESAAARAVTDAMQKLQNSQSRPDLDALNRLLPAPSSPYTHVVQGTTLPSAVSGSHDAVATALSRAQVQNIAATARHKGEIGAIVSQWSGIKVQASTPTRTSPAQQQYIDQQFAQVRGKPAAEVQRQKQAWMDEARRRFANDPKMLQKVLAYIDSHAKS